jgi:MoaA/NifB/PqqE/SkfB family radical SAM enzyme
VKLSCTLTSRNLPRLDAILETCRREGLPVKFQPASGAHAGNTGLPDLGPEPGAFRQAIRRLRAEKDRPGSPVVNSRASLAYLETWPAGRRLPCVAGRIYCRVAADGSMYPCTMIQGGPRVALPWPGVADAMRAVARPGCASCWCTSVLELNLLLEARRPSDLLDPRALWRD